MMIFRACLAMLTAVSACAATPAEPRSAAQAFKQLQTLTGVWEGAFANGRVHRVTYRMSAGDTVLVETWSLAPGRESMTMYHLDGDALIATHYCPAGNQPTLEWRPNAKPGFGFEFRSATDLTDPEASHQHRFEIQLRGEAHFWRSETYLERGEASTEAVNYRRVENAGIAARPRMQCGEIECEISSEYCVREFFAVAQPARFSCRKLPLPECGNLARAGQCSGDAKKGFVMDIVYP